jgi:hypothetical protein
METTHSIVDQFEMPLPQQQLLMGYGSKYYCDDLGFY